MTWLDNASIVTYIARKSEERGVYIRVADTAVPLTEAAKRLGVSVRTLHRMLDDGQIQGFKVRAQWRILESEIERIQQGSQGKQSSSNSR